MTRHWKKLALAIFVSTTLSACVLAPEGPPPPPPGYYGYAPAYYAAAPTVDLDFGGGWGHGGGYRGGWYGGRGGWRR